MTYINLFQEINKNNIMFKYYKRFKKFICIIIQTHNSCSVELNPSPLFEKPSDLSN